MPRQLGAIVADSFWISAKPRHPQILKFSVVDTVASIELLSPLVVKERIHEFEIVFKTLSKHFQQILIEGITFE